MLELIVGTLVTLVVGRAIFKGYSATGVLLSGGLLLLVITAMMGKPVLPSKVVSTGYIATDIFEYVRFLLNDRGGGLGMLIMVLCGFAGYMSHIGANTILVKLASKPLGIIKSPYILLVAAYLVACAMSLAVDGQHGDLPWRGCGRVRLASRHHSGTDLRGRGDGRPGRQHATAGFCLQADPAHLAGGDRLYGGDPLLLAALP
jgi:hypothetical protein